MYRNHPDSDKDNLIIAYVTLDSKFSITAILFTEASESTFNVYKYTFFIRFHASKAEGEVGYP